MLIRFRYALPGDTARTRARALAMAVGVLVLVLGLSACEDRSIQAGVNAAHQDAGNRVDEVADRAEVLADKALDETREALDDAKPRAAALADKAGDQLGKLADATGEAAIKAGDKVADLGRDAKRRATEPAGNRSATE
ncbi:MAG: hypothetical protein B7Y99_06090 [Caulobacterales bacterium 32-69-10]|nr:MAG: hypothetical protein B7Y99_06090 [Caulobacterales bacterium 32-69-10]